MNKQAKWIKTGVDVGDISPVFGKNFHVAKKIRKATARVSAMGVYNLYLNRRKVGKAILAPGFTSYSHRVLYQTYDITEYLLSGDNRVEILGGKGWALGCFGNSGQRPKNFADNISVIADIEIEYFDGEIERIFTNTDWECFTSYILDSELYHGETVDMTAEVKYL